MQQRFLETLTVKRLQQIINRVHFKRLQRVLIVSGHKNNQRHRPADDRCADFQTAKPRHLHIEKHQVRTLFLNGSDRLSSVGAFADDIEIALEFEQLANPRARRRFVVHDEGANLHLSVRMIRRRGCGCRPAAGSPRPAKESQRAARIHRPRCGTE